MSDGLKFLLCLIGFPIVYFLVAGGCILLSPFVPDPRACVSLVVLSAGVVAWILYRLSRFAFWAIAETIELVAECFPQLKRLRKTQQ